MSEKQEEVTVRRHLEQVKHCVEEALSVVEHEEPLDQAIMDLDQAKQLIDLCLKRIGR